MLAWYVAKWQNARRGVGGLLEGNLTMANATQYTGSQTNTDRTWSPQIWGSCRWNDMLAGYVPGVTFFDDFVDFGLPGTQTSEINLMRHKVYNTGAGKVITDVMPTDVSGNRLGFGGIISMLCDDAGDQSVIGTHACPFTLTSTSGRLWFEARIATTAITTNMSQIFVGLGNNSEVVFGAAIPLADIDTTGTAVSLIGFNRLEDGLGVLNTAYTDKGATTWTNVQASAGAIAANTWTKVGFMFDPKKGSNCIRFYVNGLLCTSALSATTLTALTNLDAQNLGLVFAQFADSGGTANYAYLDWWRCAQETDD